jgi:MFS family permease
MAFQMLAVAVGWQVFGLTHSAFALGFIGLAQFLPMVLLMLAVGHVADRYDRRAVAAICEVIEALATAALAAGTILGWTSTALIYTAVVVVGAARAFEAPSLQALVPTLVPAPLIPAAAARSSSANQTAVIIGPALGGLLYAAQPPSVYVVATALFAAAGVLMSTIRMERRAADREPPSLRSIFAGVAFIRARPIILGAISLDLFAVLLGGATALLPIYARDILATGPWGLGLLRAAPAVGALTTSLLVGHRALHRRVGRTMFAAVIVFGLATIAFGISHWFVVSLCALVVLGAADVMSVVIRQSLVQIRTPDAMRGRVSAVNSLFIGTSNQLGEFESGVTAGWFGAVPAVLLGGIGTIVVALLWMRLFPQLAAVDRLDALPTSKQDRHAAKR